MKTSLQLNRRQIYRYRARRGKRARGLAPPDTTPGPISSLALRLLHSVWNRSSPLNVSFCLCQRRTQNSWCVLYLWQIHSSSDMKGVRSGPTCWCSKTRGSIQSLFILCGMHQTQREFRKGSDLIKLLWITNSVWDVITAQCLGSPLYSAHHLQANG